MLERDATLQACWYLASLVDCSIDALAEYDPWEHWAEEDRAQIRSAIKALIPEVDAYLKGRVRKAETQ